MDTPKSKHVMALENFWNGFASDRRDVILICLFFCNGMDELAGHT